MTKMKHFPGDLPFIRSLNAGRFVICLIVSATIIYALSINGFLEIADDNAHFVILARSLAGGKGYTFTADPLDHPDVQYPPFFPITLAPVAYLYPNSLVALKFVPLFFMAMSIWPLYALIRRSAGEGWARSITLIWAISPPVVVFSHTIMVEALYCVVSFVALWLMEKAHDDELKTPAHWMLLIFILAAAFYTRILGVALMLTAVYIVAAKKSLRVAAALMAILGAVTAPWFIRGAKVGMRYADEMQYYTPDLSSMAGWVGANIFHLLDRDLPDLLFYPIFTPIDAESKWWVVKFFFGSALAVCMIIGFIIRIRESCDKKGVWRIFFNIRPIEAYVLVYMGMCMGWNRYFPRHYMPLLAFFWLYLFVGIKSIVGLAAQRSTVFRFEKAPAVLFLAAFLALGAGSAREIYKRRTGYQIPSVADLVKAAVWVSDNVPKEELVISRRWRWLHVMTNGVRGIGLWDPGKPERDIKLIRSSGARYLLLDNTPPFFDTGRGRWDKFLDEYQNNFKPVFSTKSGSRAGVYRIEGLSTTD